MTVRSWRRSTSGGQSVSRDHKADKDAHDPIVPVPGAKQRECLKFLTDQILTDKAFQFSPALLRRLGSERWMSLGQRSASRAGRRYLGARADPGDPEDRAGPLPESGDPGTAPEPAASGGSGSDPLRMEEVFRA